MRADHHDIKILSYDKKECKRLLLSLQIDMSRACVGQTDHESTYDTNIRTNNNNDIPVMLILITLDRRICNIKHCNLFNNGSYGWYEWIWLIKYPSRQYQDFGTSEHKSIANFSVNLYNRNISSCLDKFVMIVNICKSLKVPQQIRRSRILTKEIGLFTEIHFAAYVRLIPST